MKKIVALALCLVMVLGLMTGCQKGMDVETLVQKMDEAMKNISAQSAEMEMAMDMKMSTMGVTMTMGIDMDAEVRAKADLSAMYMSMEMAMEALGENEKTSMEIYGTMEDGAMMLYTHESDSDIWVKTVEDGYADMVNELMGLELNLSKMDTKLMKLEKKQKTVNDRKCYVLNMDMDGSQFQEYMGQYMEQMMTQITGTEGMDEETMAEVETVLEGMDWSKLSAKEVIYVDAETFLPVEETIEVLGMGDVLNSMIETLMTEVAAETDEEVPEFSVEIPTFQINIKNMAYDADVEVPAVPQEAIDNAVDADTVLDDTIDDDTDYSDISTIEPQADGSYQLALGGNYIRVMVPEGYTVYLADEEMIVGMTEDMMNSINYMLMPESTSDDILAGIMEEVTWAQEEDYYKSHSEVAELNGWQTASLIYNDDTSLWYAWMELDGGALVLAAEVEGETYDLNELIATVEIAVN